MRETSAGVRELEKENDHDDEDGRHRRSGIRGARRARCQTDDPGHGPDARSHDRDVCAMRRHPYAFEKRGERRTHEDEEARGERDRRAHRERDPQRRERHVVTGDFPLLRQSKGYRGRIKDRERRRREHEVAPVDLIPPGQHRGRDDCDHDPATGRTSARASPERERDQDESSDRKAEGRKVDARHPEDAKEQDRRGDAGRHREEPAKWFAFRGEQRLRGLIAPGHERVEAREESRPRCRGKDRARADRRWGDRVEGEGRASLPRDEEGRHDESLYSDREISGDAHRRRRGCDEQRRERADRGEDRDRHGRRDEVHRDHDRDESEADRQREGGKKTRGAGRPRVGEQRRRDVGEPRGDRDGGEAIEPVRRLDGRPTGGRPLP